MGLFSRKKKEEVINVKRRKENLKILLDSGRPKEAIAYIYLIYNDVIKNKYDKPRLAHQTIREYAITCVNELGQKPESVYPFIKKIEDIIYGGVEPTKKEFEFTVNMFSKLFNEITGDQFRVNM
ncbi:MAG: hypothetical protein GF317_17140 [Candidatus Lokiarchaeota archaeon]|nr:hypothetical protein [Candidatus Lokiarchaeota archaeon]MBD3201238.1 hypothetical protein [Candidatus Lokiarchaeota archaeon]